MTDWEQWLSRYGDEYDTVEAAREDYTVYLGERDLAEAIMAQHLSESSTN